MAVWSYARIIYYPFWTFSVPYLYGQGESGRL